MDADTTLVCTDNFCFKSTKHWDLKGQSNEIFDPYFLSFEPAWATDNIFSILAELLKFF